MDRHDEARDRRTDDVTTDDTARAGDVLGLGGATVPKAPGDPTTEYDEDSVARRRERAMSEEVPTRTEDRGRQHSGATGIDMGSGGQGTDVSGE
jgi:hypothetical protein